MRLTAKRLFNFSHKRKIDATYFLKISGKILIDGQTALHK